MWHFLKVGVFNDFPKKNPKDIRKNLQITWLGKNLNYLEKMCMYATFPKNELYMFTQAQKIRCGVIYRQTFVLCIR